MLKQLAAFFLLMMAFGTVSAFKNEAKNCKNCPQGTQCIFENNKLSCVKGELNLGVAPTKIVKHFEKFIIAEDGACKEYDEPCDKNEECCSLYCKKEIGKCFFF